MHKQNASQWKDPAVFPGSLQSATNIEHFSQPDDVAFSAVAGFYFSVLHQLPVCY